MKKDPYNNQENWMKWKEKSENGISDLSKESSDLILRYLADMENGINIAMNHKKGSRSFIRLNTLKNRIGFIAKQLENRYKIKCISDLTEDQLCNFFAMMRSGEIKRFDGQKYKSVRDYAKVFKAFWHWYQKISKKQGKEIEDITVYIDTSGEKPDWVYLNEKQVKTLCENATFDYKVLMMFLFDSGIRSPTELINVKVSDFYNDFKELMIRDEISKTFGRRIKLMICPELIKDHVKNKNLKPDDYIFDIEPKVVNRYLKRLAQRIFGDEKSLGGQKYSELTMYDFRHISCCYWLPRYKSESALKYRFGWKKSDKIHYYSEMLGMKDTISEGDMLVDVTITDIEKKLDKSEREKELLLDRVNSLEMQMKRILELTNQVGMKI